MCVSSNKMLHMSIQVWRIHTGLPRAMALRLIRDRPGDPAFCDTIALGQRWPPSNLTPASGRRTQTISPYARTTLVSRCLTSTAPCPAFATMADAPPVGQDGGSCAFDLPDEASEIFLTRGLDRLWVICPSGRHVAGRGSRFRLRGRRSSTAIKGRADDSEASFNFRL